MGRIRAKITDKRADVVLERFDNFHQTLTSVTGTAVATAIPAINLSQRNAIFIQNLTDSDLYVGGCKPELLAWTQGFDRTLEATRKHLIWTDSPTKAGEYFATTPSGGNPGLTQPLVAYAVLSAADSKAATETLLVNGSIGTLNDHEWVWGNNDSLGFNTVYFKDATGDPDDNSWFSFISYWRIPSASAFGLHLGQHDNIFVTCDGSVRMFAYSATTSNVITVEG